MKNKRILVVASHPDDEAICCGGLIMKAKKAKAKVFVLYMSTGGSRQFMNGKTTEKQRIREVSNALAYGGFMARIAFHKSSTKLDTFPQKDLIEKIEDLVKALHPNIVVIPNQNSYNQDHRAVATACITAFRPIPNSLHPQPDMILEMEEATTWPVGFTPNFYVDISKFMKQKLELYKRHTSQITKEPHYRSPQNLKRLAGLRGAEIGVKYAEAYNLLKGQL